ncbi:STM4015 family protein [Nocardiopsis flavescens]|uniref:STM4015 family protein n=1 Tax=Nocardiopsis flavescens TaxID=758803 RepID=UPI0036497CF3
MTFDTHLAEYAGRPVFEYRSAQALAAQRAWAERHPGGRRELTDPLPLLAALRTPSSFTWRLSDPEGWESQEGEPVQRYYERFCAEVPPESVEALVIGSHGERIDVSEPELVRRALVEAAPRWAGLRSLFYADLTYHEADVSWLLLGDVSAIPNAFPRLERLGLRGTSELSLPVERHASLRSLTLEGGGLPADLARDVLSADYPALEHLELWLGVEDYGGTTAPDDLAPLLEGRVHTGIRSLGLRNAEDTDGWVRALADSAVLERLEVLDLSMGTLTDAGAETLLGTPAFRGLRRLDLHRHFMTAETEKRLIEALTAAGVETDTSDRLHADGDGLYPSVTE